MSPVSNISASKIVGHGPLKIIAVHGWMGDHRLFEPTFDLWDAERVSVAFLDCRGYGERRDVAGHFTVDEIAEDIRELASALGWTRYHVMGHSMAGMSAQWLTVNSPDEVVSAILVAPVPASGAKITVERQQLLEGAVRDADARASLIDANTGGKKTKEWIGRLRDLSCGGTAEGLLLKYMTSWTTLDFSAATVGNPTPVLVVVGGHDPGTSVEKVRGSIGQWYQDLVISTMPKAGHYPMYENPRQFVDLVSIYLGRFF